MGAAEPGHLGSGLTDVSVIFLSLGQDTGHPHLKRRKGLFSFTISVDLVHGWLQSGTGITELHDSQKAERERGV